MIFKSKVLFIVVAAMGPLASFGPQSTKPHMNSPTSLQQGTAAGTFEVKLTSQPLTDGADPMLGRMSIVKQFHGALQATSRGEMLSARTATPGSAGYVAMEHVNGTLAGRRGTFVLQHSGTMSTAEQRLAVQVVPDSGTGELAGLAGTMSIRIADGVHHFDFNYTLPK